MARHPGYVCQSSFTHHGLTCDDAELSLERPDGGSDLFDRDAGVTQLAHILDIASRDRHVPVLQVGRSGKHRVDGVLVAVKCRI